MVWRSLFTFVLASGAASLNLRGHSAGSVTPWLLFPDGVPHVSNVKVKVSQGAESYTSEVPTPPLCGFGLEKPPTMVFRNVNEPALVPFLVMPGHPNYRESHAGTAVVIIPGGCLQELEWVTEGTDIAEWLNGLGISAFVLKHRVPGYDFMDASSARIDAQRAMRLLRHKAPQLGINKSRIGLMGFSSGAKMVMSLSFDTDRSVYSNVDAADDEDFVPNFSMMIYPGYFFREVPRGLHSQRMPPPIFLVGVVDDPTLDTGPGLDLLSFGKLVPQKIDLLLNPKQKMPTLELHLFPRGGHGFGRCTIFHDEVEWQEACMWPQLAQVFIEKEVLHFKPNVQKSMENYRTTLSRTFNQDDPYSLPHLRTNGSNQL